MVKKLIWIVCAMFFSSIAKCQPQIINVEAKAVDKKIVVTYTLDQASMFEISLYCSEDNGISWQGPLKSVSGDIGVVKTIGEKQIIWDVLKEREVFAGGQIIFKVTAKLSNYSFTDTRDGVVYPCIIFGDYQWMARNLNFKTASGSWIYEDNPTNETKFGRLYDWKTAQSVCPESWHLPSDEEWNYLFTGLGGPAIAGGKLKSLEEWTSPNTNATNEIHFQVLPAGLRNYLGKYQYVGNNAAFWTSKSIESNDAVYVFLYFNQEFANVLTISKEMGFSVRCVKKVTM